MEGPLGREELDAIAAAVSASRDAYLADLQRLVDIDCGTYTKAGVDEVGAWVATRLESLGADIVRHPHIEFGDTIVGTLGAERPGPALMMIGHLDTVFEIGTVAQRPFAIAGKRATGPGVIDMKSGLLAGLHAIAALEDVAGKTWPIGPVTFVANPDEELGSPTSTPLIEQLADGAAAALILEAARANGDLVTSRKGMLTLSFRLSGRAAHAGMEPHKGRSAVLEAAHKIVGLHGLNDRWDDVSVNVGVVSGGTRPNIVPDRAELSIDVRAREAAQLDAAETALIAIAREATIDDVETHVEIRQRWSPMQESPASRQLADLAISIAADLGIELTDTSTGGASDGNTTSAMGVPTLDGLGPVGGGAHSPDEYLELDTIVPRTTLLAALMLSLQRGPVRTS